MADTSSRPRPRPRPKPKAVAKSSPTPGPSSSTPTDSTTPKKPSRREDDDLDALFIRNKNRSLNTWHKFDELKTAEKSSSEDGSDSESDENLSLRSRKRGRRKAESLPKAKWEKNKEHLRSSEEPRPIADSDSDDAVEVSEAVGASQSRREGKRRCQRSRSRSITPPPPLPLQQIENVKQVVRRALNEQIPRPASPISVESFEAPADTLRLDPELEKIAREVRARTPLASATPAPVEDDKVLARVKWIPHPLMPNGEDQEWEYNILRTSDFSDLFEAIADDASALVSRLIVTYEGKRIYASTTPQALDIWDQCELEAYEKAAYEYIKSQPKNESQLPQNAHASGADHAPVVTVSDSEDDTGYASHSYGVSDSQITPSGAEYQESELEDEGDKFKLTVRSAQSKDIVLTVRSTTKCGSIVKAFLRKASLSDQYPHLFGEALAKKGKQGEQKDPRLVVDGDKMDNDAPISDADLEDGDMVEIVGL